MAGPSPAMTNEGSDSFVRNAATAPHEPRPMQRRDLIASLAATASAWPRVLRAQQKAMPVIGFLGATSPRPNSAIVASFHQGLRETGYVEGQNVATEYRLADGIYYR